MVDVFIKNACIKPLKDQKDKTVLNGFVEVIREFSCNQNKLCVYQGRQFYNKLSKLSR